MLLCEPAEKRVLEIRNQAQLIKYMTSFHEGGYDDRTPFTIGVLQELHRLTIDGIYPCAGNFRSHQTTHVEVVSASFKPSASGDVRNHLLELLEDAKTHCVPLEEDESNPTNLGIMLRQMYNAMGDVTRPFHRFMAIHPFLGGNGRVGRGFLHLVLYEMGILNPPIHILDYIERRRADYIEFLEAGDKGNLRPLQDYLFRGIMEEGIMERFSESSLDFSYLKKRVPGSTWEFIHDVKHRACLADTSYIKRIFDMGREFDALEKRLAKGKKQ